MNSSNFLQRPGGLGPSAERVKPLGSLATAVPALYQNTPEMIELNRATQLDNVNRSTRSIRPTVVSILVSLSAPLMSNPVTSFLASS
jgi:hypothetical protein